MRQLENARDEVRLAAAEWQLAHERRARAQRRKARARRRALQAFLDQHARAAEEASQAAAKAAERAAKLAAQRTKKAAHAVAVSPSKRPGKRQRAAGAVPPPSPPPASAFRSAAAAALAADRAGSATVDKQAMAELTALLDEEQAKLIEAELARRDIPFAMVSQMKPWMISGLVALPACEMARKARGVEFLDIKIAKAARAQGKQLLGLESIGEQMAAMADLPMEFHIQGLIETIKLADLMPDIMATMTDLYLQGEIAQIMPLILAAGPQGAEQDIDGYAQFEERIVRMRNHVMAERAAPILDAGNAFIAVGALHLPGEEGVVALLQDAGYTVTLVR